MAKDQDSDLEKHWHSSPERCSSCYSMGMGNPEPHRDFPFQHFQVEYQVMSAGIRFGERGVFAAPHSKSGPKRCG